MIAFPQPVTSIRNLGAHRPVPEPLEPRRLAGKHRISHFACRQAAPSRDGRNWRFSMEKTMLGRTEIALSLLLLAPILAMPLAAEKSRDAKISVVFDQKLPNVPGRA